MVAYIGLFAIGRAHDGQHLNRIVGFLDYAQFRAGDDRQKYSNRSIYSASQNEVRPGYVLEAVDRQPAVRICAYGLLLAPNSRRLDCKSLARAVFRLYRMETGIELEWYAVTHDNTEHSHAHVLVMPTDARNQSFMFRGVDTRLLRWLTDDWLCTGRAHEKDRPS